MANMKRYSDICGETVEISGNVHPMRNAEFAARFPGVKGRRYDSIAMEVGYAAGGNTELPITRLVEFKSNPSRHSCDSRCVHAQGKTFRCECSCGGRNHGRAAAFHCSEAA